MSDQPETIESIFAAALKKGTPAARAAYLAEACGDDAEARARVEALLQAHDDAGSFLEKPAAEFVPTAALAESTGDAGESSLEEQCSLDFLAPTEKPGCLGTIGQYEITEVVGRGGMGIVLKGNDPKLNRVVAVKVLAPELASNASACKRFLREGRAAAAVSHDHVVTIYGIDDGGTLPFIAMEYVSGPSLEDRIKGEGPLELTEILRIGMQIASGLAAAHEQGLAHRDVKPANILLENGVEKVKITDFGLARAVDDVRMTKAGVVTGTPEYMSPEQARGELVDHRTDLFSLGSVMYAMCTGRSPFRAENTVGMIRRVCEDTPRPIEDVNPEIPGWLIQIIDELLAKSPADRFQSASELAELLGQCLAHLQQPSVNPLPDRLEVQKFARVAGWRAPTRPRIWLAAAAAVLLLALGGLSLTEAAGLTNVAGTVIRIVRGDGTLVVQVDDPDVSVSIDGEELIITGAGANEIRLRPGEHNVHAIKDGKPVHSQLVSITRGGKEVVRVSLDLAQARTGYAYIDLQTKANHKLTESFPGYPGNNLAELPQGEQVLGGVKFNIGVGCISLNQKYGPAKVEGIPVGRSLRVLHILHGTVNGEGGGFVTAGTPIGEYRVHYDDGGTETIPIIHGEDVRDWWDWGWATAPDRSVVDVRGQASKRLKLAWRGTNELAKRFNRSDPIRLFLSTWENPSPDKRVVSIDYVATYTRTKPFCVAMSVGDSKDSSPLPVISRPGGGSQVGDTQRPNRPFFFTPWVAIADGMETINLSKTQLTDPDLVHLVGLTELKVLNLSSTPVSDAGLVHLRGLPNLQWLDLNDTRVTEAGVAGLQTALPDCLIKLTNRLVELTSPSRDANFEPEESVLLKAKTHVTGSSAEEGRVEFLVDGSPLISDKQSPFEANWLATTRGRHVLTARAFDERGRQYDSHSVSVFVGIRGLERSIESSADDAGEYGDGRMSLYSSDLDLMHIGTRFTDIRIPRGAQIKKAFLQFTADSVSRTDVPVERPDLTIHAELAASGKEFTTAEGDISSRKRTKASVKWSPEPWDVAYERSEKQRTPDLSSLIQEVVAQPDWSEGNALVLIIAGSGNREAVSFDGRRKGGAPVLYVEH